MIIALSVLIFLTLLATFAVGALIHLLFSLQNIVPPVPTPTVVIPVVMEALNLPERGTFYDLGCGDGRILDQVSKSRPVMNVIGIENNPMAILLARTRVSRQVKMIRADILDISLREGTRIFAYLGPGLMASLEPKFELELPKGALVVSRQFPLPQRKPVRVIEPQYGNAHASRLYIYKY